MLKVTNATKTFGNQIVLNDVNISLNTGQIVALVGPSGSGKSTLLRCIQKLEKLDKGTVNHESTTGFIFQDFQLFPHLTALENVAYSLRITKKLVAPYAQEKATTMLNKLGLKDLYHKKSHQLSGGQKQRVAIARALVLEPDLLLCDEPTSGLDGLSGKKVTELFLSLKSQGVAMLIASHDLEFVEVVADRVIVLDNSSVAKDITLPKKKQKLSWQMLLH